MIVYTFLFLSVALNVGLIYALYRAMIRIQEVVEHEEKVAKDVEAALDAINGVYGDLSRAANAEVLYDDPTIKRVVASMKAARTAVLAIANRLVSSINTTEKPTEDNDDDENGSSN